MVMATSWLAAQRSSVLSGSAGHRAMYARPGKTGVSAIARLAADTGIRNWTSDRLPDLAGRRILVTGANTGLGFEAAKMLAARNADIVIASRNPDKARAATLALTGIGTGSAETVTLDLADLAAVRGAATEIRQRFADGLDAIVNNAGVMQTPQARTADGFELQFATNHLGHFLLNGLLFDLVAHRTGRIVAVASIAHKRGQLHFDDLMLTRGYRPTRAYCQSKLANLVYTLELDRRLRAVGSTVRAIACHPGYVLTSLQANASRLWRVGYRLGDRFVGQSAADGAVPLVLAAAGTEARSGGYYGPTGIGDARGPVGDSGVTAAALDRDDAARLWAESEQLTGFDWSALLRSAT